MAALIFFLLLSTAGVSLSVSSSPASNPGRFLKSRSLLRPSAAPQQYFELDRPVPFNVIRPSCARRILRHSFANTINSPPYTTPYFPPRNSSKCAAPWSRAILEISASCRGNQYDRISALWLGGAELIRTSTAEPTADGVVWRVRKDVSRYSSLLSQHGLNVTMMLENIVNDEYTGVYHVKATIFFYKGTDINAPIGLPDQKINQKLASGNLELGHGNDNTLGLGAWDFYGPPADLIIPIASSGNKGFWYRIESESDTHSMQISIPRNTKRAVLELYVSYHGNDEFWYSNPPNSYIRTNNLTTGRGNGAYREVFIAIDGRFVGSEVPFPVVFTGGVNPLFWEPVVAIGAFNLPSYDIDLTPMLGFLLDGKQHEFSIGVTHGISYWLVDANLHLWVDPYAKIVVAKPVLYDVPALSVVRSSQFKQLDGLFMVEAKRKVRVAGWIISDAGNLTVMIVNKYSLRSSIQFQASGTYKLVKQKIKAKRETRIVNGCGAIVARSVFKGKYPLSVITKSLPGLEQDTNMLITNVSHAQDEKFSSGEFSYSVRNGQDSDGWMLVKDHEVLKGRANTTQIYSYRDSMFCYFRSVAASDGILVGDYSTFLCPSSS
ncbi:peptide-N4-(N-acetyl-beta-glucosaminyl)asparagine amidase A [Punica granatum]|uniref:Peptide N-acetyl-beta-D-glucosaminyl asparaginase amidase A N-terminal domain-containing protein n=2 Tax=Punica granatum TaxID=22663 RepID=A0A218XRV7_PUNGR|nr:peptide-N4-(N-acetyl-beta-glucosaminyl)asparagine amidase A [Punica granatum]OWM87396.1 hypothetical protein CDL15_Pgr022507 [Punica granatum]PKI46699.1 hypothetical protein CRG98_033041 [Punica granatum]